MQIVNVGHNHWITLSNAESNNHNEVFVYDSLWNHFPSSTRSGNERQVACMLDTKESSFKLH